MLDVDFSIKGWAGAANALPIAINVIFNETYKRVPFNQVIFDINVKWLGEFKQAALDLGLIATAQVAQDKIDQLNASIVDSYTVEDFRDDDKRTMSDEDRQG